MDFDNYKPNKYHKILTDKLRKKYKDQKYIFYGPYRHDDDKFYRMYMDSFKKKDEDKDGKEKGCT